jgi:hypothetical protein
MSVITKQKPFEKIVESLNRNSGLPVVVLGCDKCAKISETGGTVQVKKMKIKLSEEGFKVLNVEGVPEAIEEGLCDLEAVKKKIRGLKEVDIKYQILILSCGAGLKCVRDIIEKAVIIPGLETLGPGVKGELACIACGDCQFDNNGCKMLRILDDQVSKLRKSYA